VRSLVKLSSDRPFIAIEIIFILTLKLLHNFDFALGWRKQPRNFSQELTFMTHPTLSREEIAQRGKDIYQQRIRTHIETTENIGKIIAIDLNTGEYEIDKDLLAACHRLQVKQPNAITWAERIGYDAVYAIGGTLVRTAL
jgi:hypothetical protein